MSDENPFEILAVAPILTDDGDRWLALHERDGNRHIVEVEKYRGGFSEKPVAADAVLGKIEEYERAVRLARHLLAIANKPVLLAAKDSWRWLCVACSTEGHGEKPRGCPKCGCTDSWYANNVSIDDPRPMSEIIQDLFAFIKKPNDSEH